MDTYQAQLDKYILRIQDIEDTIPQAITRHEFLFTNGAYLVNTGLRARTVKFRALFYGGGTRAVTLSTDANYGAHYNFINKITDTSILHELIHPKYGVMQGYCETSNPKHDDTQNFVSIDITFIEHGLKETGQLLDIQSIDNQLRQQQIAAMKRENANTTKNFNDSGFGSMLGQTVNANATLNSQLSGLDRATRNFVNEIDDALSVFDTTLSTVSEPANTITNACGFISDVPSRLTTSINSCMYRIVGSLSAMSNLPLQFVNNMILGMNNISRTLSGEHAAFFQTRLATIGAGHIATQAAVLVQADDAKSKISISNEGNKTFDVVGNRINNTTIEDYLSATELDAIAYNVRYQIQQVIEKNTLGTELGEDGRDNQELINMAAYMQEFVNNIKLNRYIIKTMSVNNIPLHLLCLKLGLPYNAMERVLKLNPAIKNPTFSEGDLKVYVK